MSNVRLSLFNCCNDTCKSARPSILLNSEIVSRPMLNKLQQDQETAPKTISKTAQSKVFHRGFMRFN